MRRSRLESGQGALAAGLRWIGKAKPAPGPARDRRFTAEEIMEALYRALLGREPDPPGLAGKLHALRSAATLNTSFARWSPQPNSRPGFCENWFLPPGYRISYR